jgi:hypothetical protein
MRSTRWFERFVQTVSVYSSVRTRLFYARGLNLCLCCLPPAHGGKLFLRMISEKRNMIYEISTSRWGGEGGGGGGGRNTLSTNCYRSIYGFTHVSPALLVRCITGVLPDMGSSSVSGSYLRKRRHQSELLII